MNSIKIHDNAVLTEMKYAYLHDSNQCQHTKELNKKVTNAMNDYYCFCPGCGVDVSQYNHEGSCPYNNH